MSKLLDIGDSLPDADHVLRYVGKRFVDPGTDQIDGNAFLSRPIEKDDGPSVNWMEYFGGDTETQIEKIRGLKRVTYEKRGRVARLNIGQTKQYLREQAQRDIDFIYDPLPEDGEKNLPADPSHAYISNVPVRPGPEDDTPERESIGDFIVHCIVESWTVIADKSKK